MADPILEFDPAAEATGTALTITTGNYGLTSFSAPAPPPKMQWAGSVDTEGSAVAARGHENRVITIGLEVTGATALANLQGKLAKMHREGGTLKYTSPAATVNTYDVLIQDGWDPVFDHLHYLGGVTSCQFSLTCKPYGRGAEQDLGDNTESALPVLVFTEASIPGEVDALGRLVVDNDSATVVHRSLFWGIQSRRYDASATAALFFEAEAMDLASASAAAGPSGASGAGSNVARHLNVGTTPTTSMGIANDALHIGTFRAFARVQASATNTGIVSLSLAYNPYINSALVENSSVALVDSAGAAVEGTWLWVDLGQMYIPPVRVGAQAAYLYLRAESTVSTDDVDWDCVAFFPVDEGYGVVTNPDPPATLGIPIGKSIQIRHDGVFIENTSPVGAYRTPLSYVGDYLYVPPSGAESRTLRVIVMFAGNSALYGTDVYPGVATIEDLSARLFVTPRYLAPPA